MNSLHALLEDVVTASALAIPSDTSVLSISSGCSILNAPDICAPSTVAFIENHSSLKMVCSILNAYGTSKTMVYISGQTEGISKISTVVVKSAEHGAHVYCHRDLTRTKSVKLFDNLGVWMVSSPIETCSRDEVLLTRHARLFAPSAKSSIFRLLPRAIGPESVVRLPVKQEQAVVRRSDGKQIATRLRRRPTQSEKPTNLLKHALKTGQKVRLIYLCQESANNVSFGKNTIPSLFVWVRAIGKLDAHGMQIQGFISLAHLVISKQPKATTRADNGITDTDGNAWWKQHVGEVWRVQRSPKDFIRKTGLRRIATERNTKGVYFTPHRTVRNGQLVRVIPFVYAWRSDADTQDVIQERDSRAENLFVFIQSVDNPKVAGFIRRQHIQRWQPTKKSPKPHPNILNMPAGKLEMDFHATAQLTSGTSLASQLSLNGRAERRANRSIQFQDQSQIVGLVERTQELFDSTTYEAALGRCNKHSYPYNRLLVHRVIRLSNPLLWERYRAARSFIRRTMQNNHTDAATAERMRLGDAIKTNSTAFARAAELDGACNEAYLFYGVDSAVIYNIVGNGFDEHCQELSSLFGAGLYFADSPDLADQNARTIVWGNPPKTGQLSTVELFPMFLTRVVLGHAAGHPTDPVRPAYSVRKNFFRTAEAVAAKWAPQLIGSRKHNSVVGCNFKPDMGHRDLQYVVYDRSLCYPEYLVIYSRLRESTFAVNPEMQLMAEGSVWPTERPRVEVLNERTVAPASQRKRCVLVLDEDMLRVYAGKTRTKIKDSHRLSRCKGVGTYAGRAKHRGMFSAVPMYTFWILLHDGSLFTASLKSKVGAESFFRRWMAHLKKWVGQNKSSDAAPRPLGSSFVQPHNLAATIAAPIGHTNVFEQPTLKKAFIKTTLVNGAVVTVLMLDIASLDNHMVRFSQVRYRSADGIVCQGFVLLEHQKHYLWMPVPEAEAVRLTNVRLPGQTQSQSQRHTQSQTQSRPQLASPSGLMSASLGESVDSLVDGCEDYDDIKDDGGGVSVSFASESKSKSSANAASGNV